MSPWFEAAFAKYGWIWVGLTFGFAAKYALLLKRGIKVQPRLVFADLMLLPAVALIAYNLVTRTGATAEAAALVTTFCTVSADRLVKLLTERFWRQIEVATLRDLDRSVIHESGNVRQTLQKVDSAHELARRSNAPKP